MLAQEFIGDFSLPWVIIGLRLLGAALLGGLIGLDRELKGHPAGLRTNMLIALGAAAFALCAQFMVEHFAAIGPQVRMDPIRLIEAATAGVAFLAAGTIVLSGGRVKGVTTGALMWVSAAVGLTVGLGLWVVAAPTTLIALLISIVLRRFESGT